jgi:hypothetical protein
MTATEQAKDLIKNTNLNLFLTGRAGTGKTTFLRTLKEERPKRMIVLAPTGVAAINAGGSTLHSFFQLPLGIYLPDYTRTEAKDKYKMSDEKIRIMKGLELLVIDEISMVRADLLDQVSDTLKRYRKNDLPFGGVQLLLIGDLQQLPPVVKEDERALLSVHYDTPYFFSSTALKKTSFVSIELSHIYRQTDSIFIDLLEKIRNKELDEEAMSLLNSKYKPDFSTSQSEGYITLCTHHYQADSINNGRMNELSSPVKIYNAEITGNFPSSMYPVDAELALKQGAQVMFAKNDTSHKKEYYNGQIGKIIELKNNSVIVESEGEDIEVEPLEWSNIRYSIDQKTREITEIEEGSFEQIPLKLAWAITVHKSQGLTFDKVILDVQQAFAHGQVYVALSRCRSLEGLVLRSNINPSRLLQDAAISDFTESNVKTKINEGFLDAQKKAYLIEMAIEQFDFTECFKLLQQLDRFSYTYFRNMYHHIYQDIAMEVKIFEKDVYEVGKNFGKKASAWMEKKDFLETKMVNGGTYFYDKVRRIQTHILPRIKIELNDEKQRKRLENLHKNLKEEILIKTETLSELNKNKKFDVVSYLQTKAKVLTK